MKLASLCLLLATASVLPACSSATDSAADDETSAIEQGDRSTTAYRMESGDGTFLIRLTRTGDAVEGRALVESDPQGPGAPTMPIKGTVASDGTHNLTMTITFKGETVVPLVVKPQGNDLVGTLGASGDQQPAKLERIKADRDVPIVARSNDQSKVGTCNFEVGAVELFGMRNATLETKLNDTFKGIVDEARAACREDGVSGSVYLGAMTKDVIAYSSGFTIFGTGDRVDVTMGKRVNLSMVDGSPLVLFGDVITPGKQSELGALIAARIDETPDRFMPADKKPIFKDLMARRLAAGELESDFLLVAQGVSFGAKDSPMPQVRAIMVPYEKLRPILASGGRASSAWATVDP